MAAKKRKSPRSESTVDWAAYFHSQRETYHRLEIEARYIIEDSIRRHKIPINSVVSRIKENESISRKVQSKGIKDPVNELNDIVGIRVICLLRKDLTRLQSLISNSFEVMSIDNKVENSEVSMFGYQSVHFIVKIRDEYAGPRYDGIKNIDFEIQVRTVAMDAWASISHHLQYKSEDDVPVELKKDFYALSGLFHLADSQFEIFYRAKTGHDRELETKFYSGKLDAITTSVDNLALYLSDRFPGRNHVSKYHLSEYVQQLKNLGYETIGNIDRDIGRTAKAGKVFEIMNQGKENSYWDLGYLRTCLAMVNQELYKVMFLGIRKDDAYSAVRHLITK
jgi:putative GTP pyrophosphokinase